MKIKSIKTNAILNILNTITNMIFPLITYPYVTRILLASGMGKISFYTSLTDYAIMFASLGISTYGIRAVAKNRENKNELSKVCKELLILNAFFTIIVIILLWCSAFFIKKIALEPCLLLINTFIIIVTPIGMNWFFSGIEQYEYITKRNIFFKSLSLILVFIFVKNEKDYKIYAAITAFSTITSYICNYIYANKIVSIRTSKKLNLRRHLKPMLMLFASVLAISVYTNLDTVMLGFICGNREVGLYTVAVKIKSVLLAVVTSVSAVLLPRLSNYISNKEKNKYYQTLNKSVTFIFLITIPLTIYFILEASDAIILLGGEDYKDAVLCMQFLMPILIISGFSNVIGNQILLPNGRDSQFMKAVILGAIVDVCFNIMLMPQFAATGAAIATLIAEIAQMSIQFCYAKKEILEIINYKSLIKSIIAGVSAAIFDISIKNHIEYNPFINLLITALVYGGIYILTLVVLRETYINEIFEKVKYKNV